MRVNAAIHICIGLLLLASCSGTRNSSVGECTIKYSNDANTFATKLFEQLCSSDKLDNICISPASANWALSMVANGADGNTLHEIIATLGLDNTDIATLNRFQQEMCETIARDNQESTLSIANSIWISDKLKVKKPFITTNSQYYYAEIKTVPFNDATLQEINSWCDGKTRGKIKYILDKLDSNSRMILLNALYLKSRWSRPFDNGSTQKENFTKENGQEIKVQMMHQTFNTAYYCNESFKMASKPLGKGEFEMIFVLPNEGVPTDSVIKMLAHGYTGYREQMQSKRVSIGLPKFKAEYSTSLKSTLKRMGMKEPFGKEADFDKISNTKLLIDDIVQKSYIDVNEDGVEAAAVTSIMVGLTSMPLREEPEEIIMNRPFIYIIAEQITGAGHILFIGKTGEPTKTE